MVLLAEDTKLSRKKALPARGGESRSMAICASRSVLAGEPTALGQRLTHGLWGPL